jgi:probable HAF family extracellular repeat protein
MEIGMTSNKWFRAAMVATAVTLLVAANTGQAWSTRAVKVVDLGVLADGWISEAFDISDAGTVVGRSGPGAYAQHAVRWDRHGAITDLGAAYGASEAHMVNGRGEAAGWADVGAYRYAVRWDVQGVGYLLGGFGGSSEATGINDAGVVIGNGSVSGEGGFTTHALRWDPSGEATDLGSTSPGWSNANAINNAGVVVGVLDGQAVRWDSRGNPTWLERLPGDGGSHADRISESGFVAGVADTATGVQRAVRWDPRGRITDLGTLPGGRYSTVGAIGEDGTVIGFSAVTGELFPIHAVRWDRQGRITDLGTLPGVSNSDAYGVNRRGTVLGSSYEYPVFSPVVWNRWGRILALPARGDDPNMLTLAMAINGKGMVVGYSGEHAVLWRMPAGW